LFGESIPEGEAETPEIYCKKLKEMDIGININNAEAAKELAKVQGHVVKYPGKFLVDRATIDSVVNKLPWIKIFWS